MNDIMHLLNAEDRETVQEDRRRTEQFKAESLANGDFARYLMWFGGHERLQPFLAIKDRLTDRQYWQLLSEVWYNIEVSYPDRATWIDLFGNERPGRENLMESTERTALASLPERLTLFRGYSSGLARRGLSWTLSEAKAVWFGQKCARGGRRAMFGFHAADRPAMLATGWCQKRDVWAYYQGRKEEEIVINPAKVFSVRAKRI